MPLRRSPDAIDPLDLRVAVPESVAVLKPPETREANVNPTVNWLILPVQYFKHKSVQKIGNPAL